MDLETARANMVEQQIRPWQVLDARVLDALRQVRREDFVPAAQHHLAFADAQIPLGDDAGAALLEPKVTARMVEALRLQPSHRALLIGAGSGYTAALIAALAAHVTAVEIDPKLLELAQRNLSRAGVDNAELQEGDAHAGWGDAESFDAVFISGSLHAIDDSWADALTAGGRLVGIEGNAPAMRVVLLTKSGDGEITRESLFETVAPRLQGAVEPQHFQF